MKNQGSISYNTFKERLRWKEALTDEYAEGEIDQIYFWVVEEVLGISKIKLLSEPQQIIDSVQSHEIEEIFVRLKEGEPIQYILGYSFFCGYRFQVSSAVLIPRPETEELVSWVYEDIILLNKPIQILDIGTGSGCMAISMALKLANRKNKSELNNLEFVKSKIMAMDISAEALVMAIKNKNRLGASVDFFLGDILNWENNKAWERIESLVNVEPNPVQESKTTLKDILSTNKIDIIVSNPPYIPKDEEKDMAKRVKNFEPSKALFVDSDNPLQFYERILNFADRYLSGDGHVYFEIHENQAFPFKSLLNQSEFNHFEIKKDFNGKDRMVKLGKN